MSRPARHGVGGGESSYEQVLEMLVGLDAGLENALCIVDAAGIPLETEQNLFGGGGAVHTSIEAASGVVRTWAAAAMAHGSAWAKSSSSVIIQGRPQRLEAGEMVAVDMAQEAGQRGAQVGMVAEEVDWRAPRRSAFGEPTPLGCNKGWQAGRPASDVGEFGHEAVESRHYWCCLSLGRPPQRFDGGGDGGPADCRRRRAAARRRRTAASEGGPGGVCVAHDDDAAGAREAIRFARWIMEGWAGSRRRMQVEAPTRCQLEDPGRALSRRAPRPVKVAPAAPAVAPNSPGHAQT